MIRCIFATNIIEKALVMSCGIYQGFICMLFFIIIYKQNNMGINTIEQKFLKKRGG